MLLNFTSFLLNLLNPNFQLCLIRFWFTLFLYLINYHDLGDGASATPMETDAKTETSGNETGGMQPEQENAGDHITEPQQVKSLKCDE